MSVFNIISIRQKRFGNSMVVVNVIALLLLLAQPRLPGNQLCAFLRSDSGPQVLQRQASMNLKCPGQFAHHVRGAVHIPIFRKQRRNSIYTYIVQYSRLAVPGRKYCSESSV